MVMQIPQTKNVLLNEWYLPQYFCKENISRYKAVDHVLEEPGWLWIWLGAPKREH